jgi:hypothetical protein
VVAIRLLRPSDIARLRGPALRELFLLSSAQTEDLEALAQESRAATTSTAVARWFCLAATPASAPDDIVGFVAAAVGRTSEFPHVRVCVGCCCGFFAVVV